ncbi:hypothetical protein NX786_25250 [Telluria mixta]|uniref:Uncharacterized protein n=1 Tax=Telluria mixta TaxID=34071 RepID=A0ABT2C5N8_9BURK|nr:hypothetical protein [Telluria mixta]MCS0632646.1 hypothetical protein [Telluria mixta]WEM99060.1 hypothetical protein P0M04_15525 [Telluria mixta]
MRNLDSINSSAKSTKFIFTLSLIVPLFMGCGAWALAIGAAPQQPLHENPLGILGLSIASISILAFPIPYIFHWNWETKYFGAGMLSLSSGSILGIYPILCIAQYSSLPVYSLIIFIFLECIITILWCLRFVNIYNFIYRNETLFNCIYVEEPSAVYYSQQADKNIIEKSLKFEQFPQPKYFAIASLLALSLIPFAAPASQYTGVPFIHIFLAIFATPLNLMFLGLTTKGWLVFYYYPMKIKKKTKKLVYVDISSRPTTI